MLRLAKVYTLARTLACPIAVYHVAVGQGLRPCPLSPACLRQVSKIHTRTVHLCLVYHRKELLLLLLDTLLMDFMRVDLDTQHRGHDLAKAFKIPGMASSPKDSDMM